MNTLKLDGVELTTTATELNILSGVSPTLTSNELDILVGAQLPPLN